MIQLRLGEAAATLYALESMVYMTAGIADNQTDVDISMESAACKRFAVRSVKIITDHCLSGFVTSTLALLQLNHIFKSFVCQRQSFELILTRSGD